MAALDLLGLTTIGFAETFEVELPRVLIFDRGILFFSPFRDPLSYTDSCRDASDSEEAEDHGPSKTLVGKRGARVGGGGLYGKLQDGRRGVGTIVGVVVSGADPRRLSHAGG